MAAAGSRRAPILLLFITSQCFCVFVVHGIKPLANGNLHPPPPPVVVVPVNRQMKLGGAAAAAVSQARRAISWKLAEEEACRDDVSRLCPKHTWSNNLAVLECLQDRNEVRHLGHFSPLTQHVCKVL
ncbi:Golgi apparatus protein 1b [Tachysurus ichikawai]